MARDKEQIKRNKRRYYLENRDEILKQRQEFNLLNRDKKIQYLREYREKNKIILKKKKHDKYLITKNLVKQYVSDYYQRNKKICNERKAKRNKIRCELDVGFKIKQNLRSRISQLLRGYNKSNHSLELIGCSVEFLKKHLESQFTEGMNWNNYGISGWVVDHIQPCASFDLSKPKEQKKCFNYKNLQPLWEIDNLHKHAKIL
jgi:hypothetical protein